MDFSRTKESANPKGRNLVLLFDGTGNSYSKALTNIIKFRAFVEDNAEQLTYYQPGIGTYELETVTGYFKLKWAKLVDYMFATSLKPHILAAYRFLMATYKEGDRIYLVGFSRGSYTARALAGMLDKVGLLPPGNHQQVSFAYDMYQQITEPYIAEQFKAVFCRDVPIHFCGVFDTVASVGYLIPKALPFTAKNSHIKVFRQALALDERRVKFQYDPYHLTEDLLQGREQKAHVEARRETAHSDLQPDVKQIWFAGSHSDVGGGATNDDWDQKPRASHVPLRWMILQAHKAGMLFNKRELLKSAIYNSVVEDKILEYPPLPILPEPGVSDSGTGSSSNTRSRRLFASDETLFEEPATSTGTPKDGDHPQKDAESASKTPYSTSTVGSATTPALRKLNGRLSFFARMNAHIATSRVSLPPPPPSVTNPKYEIVNSSIPLDLLIEAGNLSGSDVGGKDTLAPIHESLSLRFQGFTLGLFYNIIEWILPTYRLADESPEGKDGWWLHMARGRWAPPKSLYHRSVKIRIENPTETDKPEPGQISGKYIPWAMRTYGHPENIEYVEE